MAWIVLFVAGLLEIVWSVAMKQSDGFTRLVPAAVSIAAIVFLGEAASALRLAAATLIVAGLVLMKFASAE